MASGTDPAWSPDGAKIAFASNRDGPLEPYVMNADGSGVTRLTYNVGFVGKPAWSRDGRIAYDCEVESGKLDVCALKADGTGLVRIQFHPGTTYESFIGGLAPQHGGGFTFRPMPGHLMHAAMEARKDSQKRYLLLIDEINRADLDRNVELALLAVPLSGRAADPARILEQLVREAA